MNPNRRNNFQRNLIFKKILKSLDLKNTLTKSLISAKDHEKEKQKSEQKKTDAERVMLYLKISVSLATAYGFILLLIYCIVQANFFPSGLSVGDSALLLFIALAFGFIVLIMAAMGVYTYQPMISYGDQKPSEKDKKSNPKDFLEFILFVSPITISAIIFSPAYLAINNLLPDYIDKDPFLNSHPNITVGILFLIPVAIIAFWVFVILASIFERKNFKTDTWLWFFSHICWYFIGFSFIINKVSVFIILYILLSGLILAVPISIITKEKKSNQNENEHKKPDPRLIIAISIAMLLALPFFQWSEIGSKILSNAVIQPLGLYKNRASLWVSKENLQTLEDASKLQDIPLSICRNPDGSAVVTDLRIWWHGIGSRSYVQLLGFSKQKNKEEEYSSYPRVELKSEGARLIFSQDVRCTEISDALVFPSNKTQPEDGPSVQFQLAKQIKPFIEILSEQGNKDHLVKITVIGHADPMPITAASNETLGRNRATHALSMLCEENLYKNIGKPSYEIKTMGARSPLKDCSSIKDKNLAIECNAVNRRVDLQFSYSTKDPLDDEIKKCGLIEDKKQAEKCIERIKLSSRKSCDQKKKLQQDETLDCFCKTHPAPSSH
ncbi:hypothetical protein LQR30_11620 [Chromobacterium piscinae]|uniref:hypothetical protein n=1 Tax=Chromobacterium piscinae TaxID=686831 RepID=UPI001E30DB1D|nr:hypothetical protein [Chromobacterium piscinae]MCD4504753.1 hypothetical protein [Chromobacterium piscinae]